MIDKELMWDGIHIGVTLLTCIVLYFIIRFVVSRATRALSSRVSKSGIRVIDFFLLYSIYALVVGITLNVAGYEISALLGAAGVFGVAVGFASQTTFANVISGIFLMIERSLRVGDVIAFNGVQGRIKDVGLLSHTLKTIDNKLIRIPNELLIKSNVTNVTALGERVIVFTASSPDAESAQQLLIQAAQKMELAIKDRDVSVSFSAAGPELAGFSVNIWVRTSDIIPAKAEYVRLCYEGAKQAGLKLYVSPQG